MAGSDSFKLLPTIGGVIVAVLVYHLVRSTSAGEPAALTASVSALCATWWMLEAIPLPVTALVPLALFPVFGVLTSEQVASAVGNPVILLFLGGFIMSSAMERSGAHRRLALMIVSAIGGESPKRLVFGFMVAIAALSTFISNTAALLMLLPILSATVETAEDRELAPVLFLAVAYAASIAGIGTPIGTPPNLLFLQSYEQATGETIGFASWMMLNLPIVVIMLPIAGWWLTRRLSGNYTVTLPTVGDWTQAEVRTLAVYAVVAMLWITRSEPFGGWSTWLDVPQATDASVALSGVVAMFLVPNGTGGRLLDWKTAESIPWGMLLLFAGGIAIARAFSSSGLGDLIGTSIAALGSLPLPLLLVGICLSITFLTELTSNTATAALLMPVLAVAAVAADTDPLVFMLPAVISISFAFMLPVATPTNAVIYGTNRVTIRRMIREGVVLNLIGVIVIAAYFLLRGQGSLL